VALQVFDHTLHCTNDDERTALGATLARPLLTVWMNQVPVVLRVLRDRGRVRTN
jgi:hypothetical protein